MPPTQTTPPAEGTPADAATESERSTLPYVVVRMSEAMHAKVKAHCESQTPPIAPVTWARELIASTIGWDLASDPDSPSGATRSRYADDASREAGKERNKLQAGLLRKALYQAHQGQIKKKPDLAATATEVVMALAGNKPPLQELKALEAKLNAAMGVTPTPDPATPTP